LDRLEPGFCLFSMISMIKNKRMVIDASRSMTTGKKFKSGCPELSAGLSFADNRAIWALTLSKARA